MQAKPNALKYEQRFFPVALLNFILVLMFDMLYRLVPVKSLTTENFLINSIFFFPMNHIVLAKI